MVSSSTFATDIWVKATWEEFLELAENPEYEKARFYYHQGYMRIEMAALGSRHGRQNSLVANVIAIFATLKDIEIVQFTNTSYRKEGLEEFQPDSSFYIGSGLKIPLGEIDSPIDLNKYEPPTLVLEVGSTTLSDDLGFKRLLYEQAGVREYWVNNAKAGEVIGFSISERRSGQIHQSLVLPGLNLSIINEALQRRKTQKDNEINRWLMETFKQI